MENIEQNEQVRAEETKPSHLHTMTPLSKYLAMVLFVILPFVGGWIGYSYAPEKIIEVEKVVEIKSTNQSGEKNAIVTSETITTWTETDKQKAPLHNKIVSEIENQLNIDLSDLKATQENKKNPLIGYNMSDQNPKVTVTEAEKLGSKIVYQVKALGENNENRGCSYVGSRCFHFVYDKETSEVLFSYGDAVGFGGSGYSFDKITDKYVVFTEDFGEGAECSGGIRITQTAHFFESKDTIQKISNRNYDLCPENNSPQPNERVGMTDYPLISERISYAVVPENNLSQRIRLPEMQELDSVFNPNESLE